MRKTILPQRPFSHVFQRGAILTPRQPEQEGPGMSPKHALFFKACLALFLNYKYKLRIILSMHCLPVDTSSGTSSARSYTIASLCVELCVYGGVGVDR